MPSYAIDVSPIFAAHCARCHNSNGPDGGSLGDPKEFPLGPRPQGYDSNVPDFCHFDAYDDRGDCSLDGGVPSPTCVMGARTCATLLRSNFSSYIRTGVMPPPPAAKLNDWELDVVERWIANPLP